MLETDCSKADTQATATPISPSPSPGSSQSLAIPTIEDYFAAVATRTPQPALIEQILPKQPGEYIIIAGRTGIGKTVFTFQTAFCLATPQPLLNKYVCRKSKVAYIALEGDDHNFMDRYSKVNPQFPTRQGNLHFELLQKDIPAKLLHGIETKIHGFGFDVAIFDGSRYLVAGDYCSPRDCRDFVSKLMQILAKNNVVGILTLQIKKPNRNSLAVPGDIYSIKGATEIADDATTAILLEHTPHIKSKDAVTLYFAKHRMATQELTPIPMMLDRTVCLFK